MTVAQVSVAHVSGARRARPLRLALAVVPLAFVLAGCGGAKMAEGEVSEGERRFTERLLFGGQKLPEPKPFNERELGCPQVTLLDGTAQWRVGGDSARGVSHQASIHDLARECTTEGNTMRIKVGVRGRVVLGEGGRAGSYGVPVRIVVREGDKTLHSRVVSTSVSVPDDGSVPFTIIDNTITVPVTDKDPGEAYTVVVGLDPQGSRGAAPGKKRRR